VYVAVDRRKLRRNFASYAEALAWRVDLLRAQRRGEQIQPATMTVAEHGSLLVERMISGSIRTRSGFPYKPSVIRSYSQCFETHVVPELGGLALGVVRRGDLQAFADRLYASGLNPSTIRNALLPVRVIFRVAVRDGEVAVNPTTGLELPAYRGRRDRIVTPAEAVQLLSVLPDADRAVWATALYAGLRRGELQALRHEDVELDGGRLRVERSWDQYEGALDQPKSQAARRAVPIAPLLGRHLQEHLALGDRHDGLVFGRSAGTAFNPSSLAARARRAWRAAKLQPITLHEARHTFASLMIAAGVNTKALSVYMGHASITITLDRYGHLLPGSEAQAAQLLEAYLEAGQ
jgi:integrase